MIDIKRIKENPEAVKAGFHAKEVDCDQMVDRILELDAARRAAIAETEAMKAEPEPGCPNRFRSSKRPEKTWPPFSSAWAS